MKILLMFACVTLVLGDDGFLRLLLQQDDAYPTCGDCFCAVDNGTECPVELQPQTNFTNLIPILRNFTWDNPMSLDCNPYVDASCNTNPPLQDGGACVVDIVPNAATNCPTNWSYSTRTFEGTYQEALDEGLYVTHASACGTCSSLHDLSAYMETGPALADKASVCGFRGLLNEDDGVQCFIELGFTQGCANIWYYNTNKTKDACGQVCTRYVLSREPTNGPPPNCTLADCLYCDEVNAGPIFQQYAGRSRRRSGLMSGIVRNCSEIVPLKQENPCDAFGNETISTSSAPYFVGALTMSSVIAAFGCYLVVVL